MALSKSRMNPAQTALILTMILMAVSMLVNAVVSFHYGNKNSESVEQRRTADARATAADAKLQDTPMSDDVRSAVKAAGAAALARETVRIEELANEKGRSFAMQMTYIVVFTLFMLLSLWALLQTARYGRAVRL